MMCMTQVWASGAICFNTNPKPPTSKFLSFKSGKYLLSVHGHKSDQTESQLITDQLYSYNVKLQQELCIRNNLIQFFFHNNVASVMVSVNDQVKTCFKTPHEMERQLLKLKNFCFQPHNEQETNQMESTVQKYKINSKDGTKTKYLETKYTQQQS